ncbi:phytanoyl-CoA dioxygenase family protein [Bryobacter aggregatus]|uniref:phytanoyl-CoA dioxygenase family protein n=1 Tax=Bryobacter aggregatus TaxID=360054 RepID=UPI00056587C4|nr:phytanoyl-CoA dioxygenase family protein [Bryobacter aggregatus]
MITGEQLQALDRDGFLVLPELLEKAQLEALRSRIEELFQLEGEHAGSEFKKEAGARRLANCVNKGNVFEEAVQIPEVLTANAHIMGPNFKLSSLNVRSTDPNSAADQPLHVDMNAIADEHGYWVANTIFMLDDFTPDNGATRIVPGSHRWKQRPQEQMTDPFAAHPEQILVTGKAGTLVICNAHTWHGGTANRTAKPRRAMHSFYCRADKPQQQFQKRLIDAATQAHFSPELRKLLALDDPENDRLSEIVAVTSGFLK